MRVGFLSQFFHRVRMHSAQHGNDQTLFAALEQAVRRLHDFANFLVVTHTDQHGIGLRAQRGQIGHDRPGLFDIGAARGIAFAHQDLETLAHQVTDNRHSHTACADQSNCLHMCPRIL